jgi:hypothetical protein
MSLPFGAWSARQFSSQGSTSILESRRQSMSIPYKVYVVVRYPLEDPDRMVPVKVFDHVGKAMKYIQSLEDFEHWHHDFSRIAYCGKEMYEHMEYEVE